jgi:hypothetical protein
VTRWKEPEPGTGAQARFFVWMIAGSLIFVALDRFLPEQVAFWIGLGVGFVIAMAY